VQKLLILDSVLNELNTELSITLYVSKGIARVGQMVQLPQAPEYERQQNGWIVIYFKQKNLILCA
jgi:hypothetical protein